jgi:hypothetical protein
MGRCEKQYRNAINWSINSLNAPRTPMFRGCVIPHSLSLKEKGIQAYSLGQNFSFRESAIVIYTFLDHALCLVSYDACAVQRRAAAAMPAAAPNHCMLLELAAFVVTVATPLEVVDDAVELLVAVELPLLPLLLPVALSQMAAEAVMVSAERRLVSVASTCVQIQRKLLTGLVVGIALLEDARSHGGGDGGCKPD